ncbi:MAG: alpha/beta hydrolase [Anaerolineae bacterium]|nr:alpha/beta hydrolase [Anaerolineae bacterium]
MSAITIDNELVHYEVLGRGRPVILLHGWLGSWRYWVPAMQQLSMSFRTYALDFWGFGDSGKGSGRYGFDQQVRLVQLFIEELGIQKVALIGHGLGAAVAVKYALQNPERVPRLMVVSPPLFRMSIPLTANPAPNPSPAGAASATPPATPETELPTMVDKPAGLSNMQEQMERMHQRAMQLGEQAMTESASPLNPKDAATPPTDRPAREITGTEKPSLQRLEAAVQQAAAGQVQAANPLLEHLGTVNQNELLKKHVDAGDNFEKLKGEVAKADPEALSKSIESFAYVNTLADVQQLAMPCVTVYGTKDTFLPPPDEALLTSIKEKAKAFYPVKMENNRHFPMLENIPDFARLLADFLSTPTAELGNLKIKETWERRVR